MLERAWVTARLAWRVLTCLVLGHHWNVAHVLTISGLYRFCGRCGECERRN